MAFRNSHYATLLPLQLKEGQAYCVIFLTRTIPHLSPHHTKGLERDATPSQSKKIDINKANMFLEKKIKENSTECQKRKHLCIRNIKSRTCTITGMHYERT
jgi:hypothetical protein